MENGLERLQALALVGVPQDDPLVTPAARKNLTVGRKGDRPDLTAAIFSNVREHITVVYASPPLDLRLSPGDRGRNATLRKGGSPTSGESPLAGETRNFSQNAVTCGPRASPISLNGEILLRRYTRRNGTRSLAHGVV